MAPVLLTVFNRPDLTEKVFERIRSVRPEVLFIAADGPRPGKSGEANACLQARIITEAIDWPCECTRLYRDTNLGCKAAMAGAISWFFEHAEEGIILEDDCLPDPTFFRFCSELLERYRHDTRVSMISGDNFVKNRLAIADSYSFSRYTHIWGWATWRRVWQAYDASLADWTGNPDDLRDAVPNKISRQRWAERFNLVKTGEIDTWDYQLAFLNLRNRWCTVYPDRNLVKNIGFDDRATHTVKVDRKSPPPYSEPMAFPLRHPDAVVPNVELDRWNEILVQGVPANAVAAVSDGFLHAIRRCVWRLKAKLGKSHS